MVFTTANVHTYCLTDSYRPKVGRSFAIPLS